MPCRRAHVHVIATTISDILVPLLTAARLTRHPSKTQRGQRSDKQVL